MLFGNKRKNGSPLLTPFFKLQLVTVLFFSFAADAKVQGQEVVPVLTARHSDETTAGTLMPGLSLYKREQFCERLESDFVFYSFQTGCFYSVW